MIIAMTLPSISFGVSFWTDVITKIEMTVIRSIITAPNVKNSAKGGSLYLFLGA